MTCDSVELEGVWGRMLRNKDSTVQFQEFVRQFTSRPITVESECVCVCGGGSPATPSQWKVSVCVWGVVTSRLITVENEWVRGGGLQNY